MVKYIAELLSPSGSVYAKKSVVGNTSEELSILLSLLATASKVDLCKSITGETESDVVFRTISTKQDFKPPNSFVSLIPEEAIYGTSNF